MCPHMILFLQGLVAHLPKYIFVSKAFLSGEDTSRGVELWQRGGATLY